MTPLHASKAALAVFITLLCGFSAGCAGGGGGGHVSPVVSPPPPPPPQNSNLTGPLVSESFTNDGVVSTGAWTAGTAHLPTTSTSGSITPVTFSYNATAHTYTVASGSLSHSFGPTPDAVPPDPNHTSYTILTGNPAASNGIVDELVLTNPSFGPITFQYVGAGSWTRLDVHTGANASITDYIAFAYGVETPNGAVPTSGSGVYSVDLHGVAMNSAGEYALNGTGSITADFAALHLTGAGTATFSEFNIGGGPPAANWGLLNVNIASGGVNAFSGQFTLDNFPSGNLQGRFYGPAAQELGAVFSSSGVDGSSNPVSASGYIIGQK